MLFSQLPEESRLFKATLPMWAPVSLNPDNDTEDIIEKRHDRFNQLDEKIKDKLAAIETAEKIQSIGRNFNLELLQMASIARSVRNFYFGDIELKDMPKVYSEEMHVSLETAIKISQAVISQVINDRSVEKKYQANLEEIKVSDALEKYAELNEQLITSSHIRLENFPEPVRPSIKNWLSDYTFKKGFEKHSTMERGTYLFQDENTKLLGSIERKKLGYILRAYDEGSLVRVDTAKKQIIFPEFKEDAKPEDSVSGQRPEPTHFPAETERSEPDNLKLQKFRTVSSNREKAPGFAAKPAVGLSGKAGRDKNGGFRGSTKFGAGAKMTFSSSHKFPFEREKNKRPAIQKPQPIRIAPLGFSRKPDDGGLKNLVNLKDI